MRAAGGVPWRCVDGRTEVLLVHRERYRDWTFPKGKVKPGETDEQAAVREVEEETSVRGRLGRELESTSYRDSKLRPKTVRYWALGPLDGTGAQAQNEVDEVEWVPVEEAYERLSHERDRHVLRSLDAALCHC